MKKHNFSFGRHVSVILKTAAMTLFLILAGERLGAQANAWLLHSEYLDFGFGPVSFSITAPTPYVVENSVFWDGKLQFYVSDGVVYEANGNPAGYYGQQGYGLKEVAIAPGPGSCNTWCLFWIETSTSATLNFYYQEVVVDQTTGAVSFGPSGEVAPNSMWGNSAGIAVSKVTGGTSERDIFVVNGYDVKKFHLTGLGISLTGSMPYTSGAGGFICEADISPDGQYLTWGVRNKIYRMSTALGSVKSVTVGSGDAEINGVEFSADSKYIYFSSSQYGIGRWIPNNPPASQIEYLTEGGGHFSHTQLELAKDGYIYAVRDDAMLGRIQNLSVQLTSTKVFSDVLPPGAHSYFGLPDQVDGEDYNQWVGIPPAAITSYLVNGQTVYDFIDVTHPPLLVYNCAPINLETTLGGVITDYKIEVFSTDPVTGGQITGPGYLNYTGNFTGTPPSVIDLRCLTGPGCSLFSNAIAAGHFTFAVRLTISNRCGSISRLGHIKVFDAPESAQVGLQVNNTVTGLPCPASHNISAPCPAGIYSASINLSNSQGDITYYQLAIDEVNCGTGAVIANVYSGTQVAVSGAGSLTALALNGLIINGNTGYFANPAWLGRCLKITALVGNVCGSSSDYSYLNFNGPYLNDPGGIEGRNSDEEDPALVTEATFSAYPNPFSGTMNIRISLGRDSEASLTVVDATGRIIDRPLSNAVLPAGSHTLEVNTDTWPAGFYHLRLTTSDGTPAYSVIKPTR